MKTQIHFGNRKTVCYTALVQLDDALPRRNRGSECRVAGAFPILGRENCERAVAHELENVATLFMKRRDNDIGIVVEQGNDMLRRRIGDSREAAQIAEPKHGIDAVGHAAHDPTAQHAAPGITPEVGLHQRSGHACERNGFDREG